ncbi:hypothetical protein FQN52_003325 [Onygenales sp. PD_12]|nr:hypothetical protein FQN52_003325 [Onygenales sp. PD_12]
MGSVAEESVKEKGEELHSMGSRKVIRYGPDKVIKSGNIDISEADALKFVADHTTIPVPRVHSVRTSEDPYKCEIIMDYIPGTRLDKAWQLFSHEQKVAVATQLGGYISQLRKLKGTYIGGVNRGKVTVGRYKRIRCGPFDDEQQFNDYLLSLIAAKAPVTLRECATACVRDNHKITFAHGDLLPWNIIVDQGRITAIIDWEDAGWYPEYWEHYRALRILTPVDDWPEYFHYMFPCAYKEEYIGMSYLGIISTS